MSIAIDYEQPLRAIGQALELLQMESFELETDGDDFIVHGKVAARLHFSRDREQNLEASKVEPVATPAIGNQFDLCYTLKDVHRLEQTGQARRGEPPAVAETPGLSHLLRTIGAYLEEKPARLVKIAKQAESVIVVYETLSGIRFEEKLDRATLSDWETRTFIRRAARELH